MDCIVMTEKRRVHIYNEDKSIDIFDEYPEDGSYEEVIAKHGYNVSDLDLKVVGRRVSSEDKQTSCGELTSLIPHETNMAERCAGAHKYIETYVQHFKEIDETRFIVVETNPAIMRDYAICKANYPEGIDIKITAPGDLHGKIVDIFDSMVEDLDMVTDDVAELRLKLNT